MARLVLALLLIPRLAFAQAGGAIGTDARGRIYVVDTYRNILWRLSPTGERTALLRGVHAHMLAVMPDGTVYLPADEFTKSFRWRVTIVKPDGQARDTLVATATAVDRGYTVGADTGGIYFRREGEMSQVSFGGTIRDWLFRLDTTARIQAAAPSVLGTVAVLEGNALRRSEDDTLGPETVGDTAAGFADEARGSVRFDRPIALTTDPRGTMYVADYGNRRLRKVTYNGDASTLEHPLWPWRPAGVALSGDTVYALERATPDWALSITPTFVADMLGTPRVVRVLPDGRVQIVSWVVNWWMWATSTVVVAGLITWWVTTTRKEKEERRTAIPG